MTSNKELIEAFETIGKLIDKGFRFTIIHNPTEKRMNLVSSTQCDKIKHSFPDFNIFLQDGRNQKMVERVFYY